MVRIRYNRPDAFIQISNLANEKACREVAQAIAAKIPEATVETDPRVSDADWAHQYVVFPKKQAFNGRANRALGGGS